MQCSVGMFNVMVQCWVVLICESWAVVAVAAVVVEYIALNAPVHNCILITRAIYTLTTCHQDWNDNPGYTLIACDAAKIGMPTRVMSATGDAEATPSGPAARTRREGGALLTRGEVVVVGGWWWRVVGGWWVAGGGDGDGDDGDGGVHL